MKILLLLCAFLAAGLAQAAHPSATPSPAKSEGATKTSEYEDWKGPSDGSEVHLGVLTGLGLFNFNTGYVLLGTASKKIVHHGFVNEITDSVSLETQDGVVVAQSTAVFSYSLHLRWDFDLNERWTFYALGGVGGYITGATFNNSFALFPRFGLGAFLRASDLILVRGEVSHEQIVVGVSVPFYL